MILAKRSTVNPKRRSSIPGIPVRRSIDPRSTRLTRKLCAADGGKPVHNPSRFGGETGVDRRRQSRASERAAE